MGRPVGQGPAGQKGPWRVENYGKETKKEEKKEQAKNLQEKKFSQKSGQGWIGLQSQGRLSCEPETPQETVTQRYGQKWSI